MELHLKIAGSLLIILALCHIGFPNYFKWKTVLEPLDLFHRQMLKTHTFFIALVVLLMGGLCIGYHQELIHTQLGKIVCVGLAIFWSLRLFFQFFVYSPKLWKGKTFETSMHFLFSAFWIYLSTIFWMIYWG